jgi:hypothetical protein
MSTAVAPKSTPSIRSLPTLLALARADARRFARHPLFLFGVVVVLLMLGFGIATRSVATVSAVEGLVFPVFLLGVFGFVVAHRLTTSLRRSGDLADTSPTGQQRRTIALCLACLVPMAAGVATIAALIIFGAVWPPESIPPGQRVAWFGHEPTVDMLAALVATLPLAALGGPLLGVAVARWAPFRGSALFGVVILVVGAAFGDALPTPWFTISPWFNFMGGEYSGGQYHTTWLRGGVEPLWTCGYYAALCGLAVVAALLRDNANRRPLLLAGGLLTAVAAACLVIPVL